MAEVSGVTLLGSWSTSFTKRIEIALKLKGVQYEYIEEDYLNKTKSDLLLKVNPVTKKLPVFIHNGKPLAESSVILEYIDETWNSEPKLLPTDLYERAQARFWSKFFDEKVCLGIIFLGDPGDAKKAAEEFCEALTILENQLKGKKFFGGDKIGIVDLVGLRLALWAQTLQEASGRYLFTRESFPLLSAWADEVLSIDVIKETVPKKEALLTLFRDLLPKEK